MENSVAYFETLYKNFNNRNISAVIENMTADVKWANGMDGGHVYGQEGVKEYWTRQFGIVSAKVTPLEIKASGDEVIIKVHQVVHDLEGNLLGDEILEHIFTVSNEKIAVFDIQKNGDQHS